MVGQSQKLPQRQNTEQKRGRQAWLNIQEIKGLSEAAKKFIETAQNEKQKKKYRDILQEYDKLQQEYRSRARELNAMIRINGLGQTLGFLKAKGKNRVEDGRRKKNAPFYLLGHLSHWMHDHFDSSIPDATEEKNDGLLDWVTRETTTNADYRRATTECLAFGIWLSRFAEAELKDPDDTVTESSEAQGEQL